MDRSYPHYPPSENVRGEGNAYPGQQAFVQSRVAKASFFNRASRITQDRPVYLNIGGDYTPGQSSSTATQVPHMSPSARRPQLEVDYFTDAYECHSTDPTYATFQGNFGGTVSDLIPARWESPHGGAVHTDSHAQSQHPPRSSHGGQQHHAWQPSRQPPMPPSGTTRPQAHPHRFATHSSVQPPYGGTHPHGTGPQTIVSSQSSQYSVVSNINIQIGDAHPEDQQPYPHSRPGEATSNSIATQIPRSLGPHQVMERPRVHRSEVEFFTNANDGYSTDPRYLTIQGDAILVERNDLVEPRSGQGSAVRGIDHAHVRSPQPPNQSSLYPGYPQNAAYPPQQMSVPPPVPPRASRPTQQFPSDSKPEPSSAHGTAFHAGRPTMVPALKQLEAPQLSDVYAQEIRKAPDTSSVFRHRPLLVEEDIEEAVDHRDTRQLDT